MTPSRVVDQYPRSLEAQLLLAGRTLEPPRATYRTTLARLGLLAASLSGTNAVGATAASGTGSVVMGTVVAKWVTIGVVAGASVFGLGRATGVWKSPAAVTPPVVGSSLPREASVAAPGIRREPLEATGLPTDPTRPDRSAPSEAALRAGQLTAATTGPRASSPTSSPSLGEEVATVDEIRRALRQGQAGRAIELIDQHARRFRTPRLAEEAAFLRVQALRQLGRVERAREELERFRRDYPTSPLAEDR